MKQLTVWIVLNVILVFTFVRPVQSLGWKDKEWVDAGCPESITGYWTPRSEAAFLGARVRVTGHQLVLHLEAGELNTIDFQKISESPTAVVLALDVRNLSAREPIRPFLRIRPHLVNAYFAPNETVKSQPQCLIKVFRYQSLEDILPNKYSHWGIYQIQGSKPPE